MKCGASSVRRRPDVTRVWELNALVTWLLGKDNQQQLEGRSARSFRRATAWCWNVEPTIAVTGEVYDEIQLDGMRLADSWWLLIAINGTTGDTLGWQWAGSENEVAWTALISRFPPPRVAVTDGGTGLKAAISKTWPETVIQRCLKHIQRNVVAQTTLNPRLDAGVVLLALVRALLAVADLDHAVKWLADLSTFKTVFAQRLNAKTLADAEGAVRPRHARVNARWWYTHYRLRRGYKLLEQLARDGHLFVFLEEQFADFGPSRTTNRIEGGTNQPVRDLLYQHRGMPSDHQRRAVEWLLFMRSYRPPPIASLIRPEHWQPAEPSAIVHDAIPGDYGTENTIEEGLATRQGWGGRSASGFTAKRPRNNAYDG